MARISLALHEMCQPLTALLCLLEMAEIETEIGGARQLMTAAIGESERLRKAVLAMREMVRSATPATVA